MYGILFRGKSGKIQPVLADLPPQAMQFESRDYAQSFANNFIHQQYRIVDWYVAEEKFRRRLGFNRLAPRQLKEFFYD